MLSFYWNKCCYFQGLSKSKISSKNSFCKLGSQRHNNLPLGYRQVHINWFDLDKCNVCHMDEVEFRFPFQFSRAPAWCFIYLHALFVAIFVSYFFPSPVVLIRAPACCFLWLRALLLQFLFLLSLKFKFILTK